MILEQKLEDIVDERNKPESDSDGDDGGGFSGSSGGGGSRDHWQEKIDEEMQKIRELEASVAGRHIINSTAKEKIAACKQKIAEYQQKQRWGSTAY